jgi:hypothetical protein
MLRAHLQVLLLCINRPITFLIPICSTSCSRVVVTRILFRSKDTVAFGSELMVVRFSMSLVATAKSFVTCSPSVADNSKYAHPCLPARSFAEESSLDPRPTLFLTRIAGREPRLFMRISSASLSEFGKELLKTTKIMSLSLIHPGRKLW